MKMIVKSGQILHDSKIYYTGETLEIADDAAELLVVRGLAEPQEGQEKSLEEMTVKELTAYAEDCGIQLHTGTKKKADLIAAIQAAESGQVGELRTDGDSGAEEPSGDGPVTGMPEE